MAPSVMEQYRSSKLFFLVFAAHVPERRFCWLERPLPRSCARPTLSRRGSAAALERMDEQGRGAHGRLLPGQLAGGQVGVGTNTFREWVTLEEDGAIKGSAHKMLFICEMDAKVFCRTDKFVGFVCITGPPGGGKGTVIYTAMDEPICATTWGPPTSSTTGSANLRTASRYWPAWPARQRATATSTRIAGSTRRP